MNDLTTQAREMIERLEKPGWWRFADGPNNGIVSESAPLEAADALLAALSKGQEHE